MDCHNDCPDGGVNCERPRTQHVVAYGMLHVPLPGLPEGAVHVVVVPSDCTEVSTTVAAPIAVLR